MEPRIATYVDPADVLGGQLNEWQDATVELRFANQCSAVPATWNPPATLATRRIGCVRILLHHQCDDPTAPGNGTETVLDTSVDWRDVHVDRGWVAGEDAAQKMPGGTLYAAAVTYPIAEIDGYTGKGAAGAAPPGLAGIGTPGVGEYWTPWANFWLYARDTDGALCVWNDIGSTVYLWGVIGLTGDFGAF